MKRTPLAAGFDAAMRHLRLATSLWLFLAGTALVAWVPFRSAFEAFDRSPFRETILKGWDSWAFLAFIASQGRELGMAFGIAGALLVLGALVSLFLTGGILRVLIADVERPVLRRLVAESAALFRVNLWATVRFAITLAFWEGVLVGAPVGILRKIAKDTPPNGPLFTIASWWMLVVGLLVLANVLLRFDLARVALARGDAPTARGAYRVAKQRLVRNRGSAIALGVFWLAAFLVCQVLFRRIGAAMNPSTDGGISALVIVQQVGFLILMMLRVGWWASLLAWEKRRQPMAMPVHVPAWAPAPVEPEPAVASA